MMDQVTSVMIVGVGGQGSLLASRLLGHVLLEAGYDVKVSEVHGMSQRGRLGGHLRPVRQEGGFPGHRAGGSGRNRLL